MRWCQDAKPTGGDITLTVKPCQKPVKTAHYNITSQNLRFHWLYDNTVTRVSDHLQSFQKSSVSVTWCSVCVWTMAKLLIKSCGFENTLIRVDWALNSQNYFQINPYCISSVIFSITSACTKSVTVFYYDITSLHLLFLF